MEPNEQEIDENDAPRGYRAAAAAGCPGCAFAGCAFAELARCPDLTECSRYRRRDGIDVIFIAKGD